MSDQVRTDQVPEVSGDDSGLVPPQSGPKQEWPKKIRTLTAGELDRLTIDAEGRFYWDGRLVNYEGQQPKPAEAGKTSEGKTPDGKAPEVKPPGNRSDLMDLSALEILDRAAIELSRPQDARAGAPAAPAAEDTKHGDEAKPGEVTAGDAPGATEAQTATAMVPEAPKSVDQFTPVASAAPAVVASMRATEPLHADEFVPRQQSRQKTRFALSIGQSLALLLVVLSLLVAAGGIAAVGWVAWQDWGCRVGTRTGAQCPAPPPAPPAPPVRPDIPL